jgi:hypothetical protein
LYKKLDIRNVVKEGATQFKIIRHEFLQETNLYKARRKKE